jgi:hypothetical protein
MNTEGWVYFYNRDAQLNETKTENGNTHTECFSVIFHMYTSCNRAHIKMTFYVDLDTFFSPEASVIQTIYLDIGPEIEIKLCRLGPTK